MSPQDTQLLTDFLAQLVQARGIQKDPDADALIQRAVAQQPDAAYLLVQRALLLEQGLNNARSQIAGLQEQLREQASRAQPDDGGKFLDPNAWGNSGRQAPAQVPAYPAESQPGVPVAVSIAIPTAIPARLSAGRLSAGSAARWAASSVAACAARWARSPPRRPAWRPAASSSRAWKTCSRTTSRAGATGC